MYLFLSINPCHSQIIISGILSDSTGSGIEYANVQIIAGKSYFLTSDSLGQFSQSVPAPGLVQIKANHISYFPWDSAFRVYHDTTFVITLKNNLKYINEVIVNGRKYDNINNSIIINQADISLSSKMLGETDILSILQKKTGIAHPSEVSPGLYVRGMPPGNTGIFFGGTELFGTNHILSIYPQFNSDAFSNISLVKADFDPSYNAYLSSVLLIEPDHQLHSKFSGNAELGVLNAKLTLCVPIIKDNISAKIAFRRSYFDLIAGAYNSADNRNLPQYGFSEFNSSLVWHTKKKGVFTLDLFSTSDKIIFDDINVFLSSDWENHLISGKWNMPLSEKADFELLTGYTWSKLDVDFANLLDHSIQNTVSQAKVSSKLTYRFSNKLKCETGTDLILNQMYLAASSDNANNDDPPVEWKVPAKDIAIYEKIKWSPARGLKLEAGSRLEFYYSDSLYVDLMPFLSVSYRLQEYQINLSYSKRIQNKHLFIPTGINLPMNIWYPSQSDVPPEKARHYNISVTKNILKEVNLSLSAYYISLYDLTEFLDGNYFTSLQFTTDLGYGYSKGIETSLRWKRRNIEIEGGFTISKSKRKFPLINGGTWFSPSFDIRKKADINIIYRYNEKWTFSLSQFVQDGFIMTLPSSIYIHQQGDSKANNNYEIIPVYTTRYNFRMPISHRMDISASHNFNWGKTKASLTFGIYNVYNYQNPYFIYFTPQVNNDSSIILKSKKKSLLPMVPFASLKISF